jgi:NTE family protein
MRWLAEKHLLENVKHISSVSGGSLFMGLLFQIGGYRWPTSAYYLDHILPQIRTLLTTTSLQWDAARRLSLNPCNWRFILARANILSMSIQSLWSISATLNELPQDPVWSINGTTAENGRRFRFKAGMIGDYETGYAIAKDFKLADAMAVSAAFPGGIGPLRLDASRYHWFKRKSWGATVPEEEVPPPYDAIHLYDGGVYDNLGLEPLFDVGKQIIKTEFTVPTHFLIVADASAPFSRRALSLPLNPLRLKRVADIAFVQARALRVRSFVNFISAHPTSGMYLQIESEPLSCIKRYAKPENIDNITEAYTWFSRKKVHLAASHKTTLRIMHDKDFDLIAEHAYQTSLWNELVFFRTWKS